MHAAAYILTVLARAMYGPLLVPGTSSAALLGVDHVTDLSSGYPPISVIDNLNDPSSVCT